MTPTGGASSRAASFPREPLDTAAHDLMAPRPLLGQARGSFCLVFPRLSRSVQFLEGPPRSNTGSQSTKGRHVAAATLNARLLPAEGSETQTDRHNLVRAKMSRARRWPCRCRIPQPATVPSLMSPPNRRSEMVEPQRVASGDRQKVRQMAHRAMRTGTRPKAGTTAQPARQRGGTPGRPRGCNNPGRRSEVEQFNS